MRWSETIPNPAVPPPGTVACWCVDVPAMSADSRRQLFDLMSDEERARAERFVRTSDRHSFTAAHGALRVALALMLGRDPREFRFEQGAYGKPELAGGGDLRFNMSHSGGLVLIALAKGVALGADIERMRPLSDRADIVRRFFHPGEQADLAGLPEAEALPAFFRCWTRKEAVVKALGVGMSLELDRYRVSCKPDVPAALLALDGEKAPQESWSIVDLEFGPSAALTHLGAIAARTGSFAISRLSFAAEKLLPLLPMGG